MPTWDTNLRGVHRDVAADPGRLLHVLAGPGTGKTFAMMRRVARLLEEDVLPDKILIVSLPAQRQGTSENSWNNSVHQGPAKSVQQRSMPSASLF